MPAVPSHFTILHHDIMRFSYIKIIVVKFSLCLLKLYIPFSFFPEAEIRAACYPSKFLVTDHASRPKIHVRGLI